MKKITSFIVLILAIVINAFPSAIISGRIVNAKSRFISLVYTGASHLTGPNYFGIKNQCEYLNDKGEFKFVIETSTEYSIYDLQYNNGEGVFEILLRDRDSININVDLNKLDSTFVATGKGSGFTNFEFALDMIMPEKRPELADDKIISFWERQRQSYLYLLNSFKTGVYQKNDSISDEQVININRLIKNSNLSSNEIDLIKNKLNSSITSSIRMTSFEYLIANIDNYLQLFKDVDFSKNYIINDFSTNQLAENYIQLLNFKDLLVKKGPITRKEAYQYSWSEYFNTAKKVLNGNMLEKHLADILYDLLMEGDYKEYEELLSKNKDIFTSKIYIQKLTDFYNNYLGALNNNDFNLNSPDRILNDSTVKILLNSLKGQKIYLILWKISSEATYTLTPLWELPELRIIQNMSKDKNIRFINICLGEESIKQHWASMIVNHQWNGEHYLYANGNKEDFRKMLKCEDGMRSCVGKLYYILDTNGNIIKDNGSELIINLE